MRSAKIKSADVVLVICIILGLIVLCGLGSWQIKRLIWKEHLIEQVKSRLDESPQSLDAILKSQNEGNEVEYYPLRVEGTFDHDREVYFYTTQKGRVGWDVHTPLLLDDNRVVIVNRGFVPDQMRDPAKRSSGQVAGKQKITGLTRKARSTKPNSFIPDNNLEKREFYWRSWPQIVKAMYPQNDIKVVPLILDADDTPNPGGLPQGGTTILKFSNNHLQYAITWFGLALTLLGVGGYFLFTRIRGKHET